MLSRDREQHKHLLVLPGLTLENCDVYDEAQLSERFRGKDVVINLVGILNERGFGGGGFRRAHTELTRTRAAGRALRRRAPAAAGVRAQGSGRCAEPLSALQGRGRKADPRARQRLDWTIFQPSVMFGPGDTFLNRFAGLLASVPFVFPLARPNARFQPVFVDDVVDAHAALPAQAAPPATRPISSAARRSTRLREIVHLVARTTGRRRWIVGLPNFAAWLQGLVMNFVPGRPFSSDNYRSLKVDSVCTDDGFAKLKIKPHSMAASARQYLGAFEDNARLSRDRAAAGKSQAGHVHIGGATADRP